MNRSVRALALVVGALLSTACAATGEPDGQRTYGVAFQATLSPADSAARASITVSQDSGLLRVLDFNIDPAQSNFQASGELALEGERLRWTVPATGGVLRYSIALGHERSPGRYDTLMTESWALFRGGDLFPPARARTEIGAEAAATLLITGPPGWSLVTPFGSGLGATLALDNPSRRFDRPTGWMVAGKLGVRRDQVGNTRTVVAGPVGHGVRRQDMLALLNWTLPTLNQVFGPLPEHLLIVSAGDPMWRGGLSGPNSLFIHADRPLISENGTSSLLHELVHVVISRNGAPGDDWLIEGVAEYYALETLLRSGTISQPRYHRAHEGLARWGADVVHLDGDDSRGKVTARAVALLADLNSELKTQADSQLDHVIREMIRSGEPFSRTNLLHSVERVAAVTLPDFSAQLQQLLSDDGSASQ